jgi:hypothetical protein
MPETETTCIQPVAQDSPGDVRSGSIPQELSGNPLCPHCKGVGFQVSADMGEAEPCPVCYDHPNMIEQDGWILDSETGEVLGSTEVTTPAATDDTAERDKNVLWALERRARNVAKAQGLEEEMNSLIATIRASFEPQINNIRSRVKWIDNCFTEQFRQYAIDNLIPGQKNAKTPWAILQFTSNQAKWEIADEAEAKKWALEKCSNAVKLEFDLGNIPESKIQFILGAVKAIGKTDAIVVSIMKSRLPKGDKANLPKKGFKFIPAGAEQSFKVSHGGEK